MKFDRMVVVELELRDYQLELLRKIEKEKSCILFLPAGTGKTHIAFRLMESMAGDLKKPISEGGKRTFFLVNTVQLVQQQGNLLSELGNFKVVMLTGDSGVDNFNETHWCSLEDTGKIFVLTTQIYLDALNYSYLRAENANLLVFDECHHAVGDHPMAKVMRLIQKCEDGKKPKILGLSATLLNANIKNLSSDDFDSKLGNLKSMFGGRIITFENSNYISESHSAKPIERIINFEKYEISEKIMKKLAKLRDDGAEILKVVKLKDGIDSPSNKKQSEIQLQKPGSNRSKLLHNVLNDILMHVYEYGLYVGYICCQSYIIQLYRHMFVTHESRYINVLSYTINLTLMMRKILYTSIEVRSFGRGFETMETILETSCGKVRYVLDRFRRIKSTDTCLIFVQRKMTAKSLFRILKISTEELSERELSIDFIVGSDRNPLRNFREGFYDGKERRQVLENFKTGFINVLIATDVLEEGIDVQRCNLVIMFDPIKTYRSYIQSKGRARVNKGEYIILNDESRNVHTQINYFRNVDVALNRVVDDNNVKPQGNDKLLKTNLDEYRTSIGASVSSVSAISIIYLYCATLPKDLFTDLVPYWFYDPERGSCRVQLPSSAGIRKSIQGPPRSNYKTAKQAAALEAVKILHQSGQLDGHLVPVKIPKELSDANYWFPNWDSNDNEEQEKAKKRNNSPDNFFFSELKIPEFLKDSRPISNIICYLHVIHMKPEYEKPKLQRHLFCHNLIENDEFKFGILTSKPLPSIFEFNTYTDLGEVLVTIQVNAKTLSFSEKELEDISKFHRTLFLDVLKVVQKCFTYDIKGDSNGYFVVPLRPCKKSDEAVKLSWKCIKKKLETSVVRPSDEEIRNQMYTAENYVGKVVTPWYKEGLRYIVCDVSKEKNLTSTFGNEKFATFEEYFFRRYSLKPRRPGQPLLLVRPISANINGSVPRPISVCERNRRSKRDSETYLPPEYCHTYSFPSVYWYKTILLPSILHRMFHLLIAEELRQKIVNVANVGSLMISREAKGDDTIEFLKKNCKTRKNDFQVVLERGERIGLVIDQKEDELENQNKIKDTTELQKYADDHEIPCTRRVFMHNFTRIPKLVTLKDYNVEHSPQAHQILEALTLRCAGDTIHLERLEVLGDSLLKYLVSVFTYLKCPNMNEGHLTILRSRLVSNQNLFYCGKKLNMASYIKAVEFSTKTAWYPPGFLIPNLLGKCFSGNPLSSLLAVKIPYHEQFSGNISMETIERVLKTDIANYIKKLEEKDELLEKRINFYFGKQELKRKDISDVLEALLGVYVQACGIEGAFKLLKYFGILSNESMVELFSGIPPPNSLDSAETIDVHDLLPGYETIEKICDYQFKNKFYLLQAFTHPSFRTNYVTDCYQKLEFLGDAVLDFLITSYIYQYCGDLTPGRLTDLKSSLVNNNTFGALAVRLKLHKHLLCHSERLWKAIETFATYQESKNDEIHGNELIILINETDTAVAEEVDVPKALGDIFESLAGAIFLDSSCNLSIVWNSFYKILREEINKFSKNVPINAIRALHEKVPTKITFTQVPPEVPQDIGGDTTGKTKVLLKIILNKETRSYIGQGDNIKAAKRAAAKYALRDLNCDKFVI